MVFLWGALTMGRFVINFLWPFQLELTFHSGNFVPNFLWSWKWSYTSHKIHIKAPDALLHSYPCPAPRKSCISNAWILLERIHSSYHCCWLITVGRKLKQGLHIQKGCALALPIGNLVQDYWVSGLCPSSNIPKGRNLSETGSDFNLRWKVQWWRSAFSNGHNWVGASPLFHLRTETDMVSIMCSFRIWWWMKSRNLVILSARHHWIE
jgi:hypothetical protein